MSSAPSFPNLFPDAIELYPYAEAYVRWLIKQPVVIVMIAAAVLRLAFLNSAALWYDESGTLWMASLPFMRMIAATAADTHPPLYLALMWIWVRLFGFSEISARLPSVFFSLIAIYLAYQLMFEMFDERAALWGAIAVALLPAQIYYAQEARMYALLTAEFVFALLMAWRGRYVWLAVALASMYWTHNYGFIYAVPVNALAIIVQTLHATSLPKRFAFLFIANAAALMSWMPWMPTLIAQMKTVSAGYWIPPATLGSALDALYKSVWGMAQPGATQTPTAIILFGLLIFVVARSMLTAHRSSLILLIVGLLPFAAVTAASLMWRSIFLARGFVPAAIPLVLAATATVSALARRDKLIVAAFIVPVLVASLTANYLLNPPRKGYVQPYLTLVKFNPQIDVVIHVNEGSYMALHWYAPPEWKQFMLRGVGYKNIGALSDGTRLAMGFALIDSLDDLDYKRAWIIYGMGPTNARGEEIALAELLRTHPHEVIEEHKEMLGMNAIYLVYNPKWSVP